MRQLFLLLPIVFFIACNSKTQDPKPNTQDQVTLYTCSMDPQVKEDKPGKCPICHMELTAIKHNDTEANEISLSKQQIQLGNITTQTISEESSSVEQSYTGVLTINQERIKTISVRSMGRIEKLYFKTLGDYVNKGEATYVLYSEDIAIAKQDYVMAYKQLSMLGEFGKNARNLFSAAKQKLLFFGLTNAQLENLKTGKDVSPRTTFYSTYSGTITEIMATEGSFAMEGSGIIKLADLNTLWLETQVNVNYVKNLKIGQNAEITFTDYPDKIINTKISFVNPEINPDSRLLLIRMEIPNPNLLLKPGMQAITKLSQPKQKGLFIPTDAVIREENSAYIWVEKRPGVYENLMVETGLEANGMIEIKTPLDSRKKVVVTGAYAINSEYIFRKGNDPMEGMKM